MDQELVQYLDERFNGLIHGLDQRFDRIEQRLGGHDRRFEEVNARFAEVNRHSGVLVEGLRHEVHLVAEALTMHIQAQHVQEREYFDRKFEDTHALIRTSYSHLQQQRGNLC